MTKPPVFVLHFVLKTGGFGLIGTIRLEIFIDYRSVKRRPNNPVTITGIRKHARQPEGLAGAGS